MADLKKQGRSWLVSGSLIAVGAVIGYVMPQNAVSPKSEIGTVTAVSPAGNSQTLVVFKPKSGRSQHFHLDAAATPWQATPTGSWTTGQPACLAPGSATPITLGVVTIHPVGSAPGGTFVAWVECYS